MAEDPPDPETEHSAPEDHQDGDESPQTASADTESLIDPNTQCGVKHLRGRKTAHCPYPLDCKIHSVAQKQAVTGRARSFDNLLQEYLSNPRIVHRRSRRYYGQPIDPDVHCAVWNADGKICSNVLTCNLHKEGEKRLVQGRSQSFDELLRLYHINTAMRSAGEGQGVIEFDSMCAVLLPNGSRCNKKLSCNVHTKDEKKKVTGRTYAFSKLFTYHTKQKGAVFDRMGGYGLAVAPAREDPAIMRLRRRYRRDGMQNATMHADSDGEVREPQYVMLSPVGENLGRIRQILYGPDAYTAAQDIESILSQTPIRAFTEDTAAVIDEADERRFCFLPRSLQEAGDQLLQIAENGRIRDAAFIRLPHHELELSDPQAKAVMKILTRLMTRVPCALHKMNDILKRILLFYAVASVPDTAITKKAVKKIDQALVDNKPSLVMQISYFDTDSQEAETVMVALPMHCNPKDVAIPERRTPYAFTGQLFGQPWLGNMIPEDKQKKLFGIAAHTVSSLHLKASTRKQVHIALVSISHFFEVTLLVGPDKTGQVQQLQETGVLAAYQADTGIVAASADARAVASWLTDITVETELSGWLVVQCINNRFAQTHDLWLSWADGANAADLHKKYPGELLTIDCSCSSEQAKIELHRCSGCGAMTVCQSLSIFYHGEASVKLCPKCRASDLPAGTQFVASMGKYREPERTRVIKLILQHVEQEHGIVYPDGENEDQRKQEHLEAQLLINKQLSEATATTAWHFTDVYMTSLINRTDSRLQCSVEALSPLAFVDGQPRYHHASNMGLTKLYANQLCGSFPPITLPILHRLDSAHAEEDIDALVERADHLHIIRSQIPWRKRARLTSSYDPTFIATFEEECRTGVATSEGCRRIAEVSPRKEARLWETNIISMGVKSEDELPEIADVREFFDQLALRSSKSFRRLHGVPFPFKGGPTPDTWSWTNLYGLIANNFITLKRWCNSRHVTNFNLPRLVVTVVRLIIDGRSLQPNQLLDLPLSLYNRSLLKYSVGKDDHARAMSTAILETSRITIDNFDSKLANLCVEPWVCNSAKGNRDADVDAMRDDFRNHLPLHNSPYWADPLLPLDAAISLRYIHNASITMADFVGDEGDPDEGEGAGDDEVGWPIASERRNMSNLSQTCYMSTVLQILRENPDVRDLVANNINFLYKDQSGRNESAFLPHNVLPADLSPEELTLYQQMRRNAQRLLVKALQELFSELSTGGDRLPLPSTRMILGRVQLIDSRWANEANESAELLEILLDTLVSASDNSVTQTIRRTAQMASLQEAQNKIGLPLAGIVSDSDNNWNAFVAEGYDSSITAAMYSQVVQEIPCGDDDCTVVSRSFEHSHIVYLDFPSSRSDLDDYQLSELLAYWHFNELAKGEGHACDYEPSHKRSESLYRCFARPAKYVCFAIRRGGVGDVHIRNHVEAPEELDLVEYMKKADMPSQSRQEQARVEDPRGPVYYDLYSVNYWTGAHYIAYQRVQDDKQNSSWRMFDDLDKNVRKKAPSDRNERELIHFVVYKRREVDAVAPISGASRVGEDDYGFDVSMGGTDDEHPPPALPPGVKSTEHSRTPRARPESSDQQLSGDRHHHETRSVRPRGPLHGDVAAAGQELDLGAREAQLELETARVMKLQSAVDQREEDVAERMKQLDIREAKIKELEGRAARGSQLTSTLLNIRAQRDQYLQDIADAQKQGEKRKAERVEELAKLDSQRKDILARIDELQAQLKSMDEQRADVVNRGTEDRKELGKELIRLKGLIMALLD